MKSAAEVLARLRGLEHHAGTSQLADDTLDALRAQLQDAELGVGEFAPELTDEQKAARQRLIDDFLAPSREHFGLDGSRGPKLDPIHARLASWATPGGCDNTRRVGPILYSWTAHPRLQQNGSGLGRVYAQKRGESPVDIGGYKLDASGNVLEFPAAARAEFGIEEAS